MQSSCVACPLHVVSRGINWNGHTSLQPPPVLLGLLVSNNVAVMRPLWADEVTGFGVVAPLEAVLTELKLTLEAPCHRWGEDAGGGDAVWAGSVRITDTVGEQQICCTWLLGLGCAHWDSHYILDVG